LPGDNIDDGMAAVFETKFPADVQVAGDLQVVGKFPTIHHQAVTANTTLTNAAVTHVGISTLGANLTVTLGTLGSDYPRDLVLTVKDETGNANPTDRIVTIVGSDGDTIDGDPSVALTVGYEALTIYGLVSDGKWFIH
jgi:hypothetical protein